MGLKDAISLQSLAAIANVGRWICSYTLHFRTPTWRTGNSIGSMIPLNISHALCFQLLEISYRLSACGSVCSDIAKLNLMRNYCKCQEYSC